MQREREREALLSFKNGLIDEYDNLLSWRSDDCCKWHGVECSNTTGHIITLQLDHVNLRGDAEVRCIESEREALLSFKNGLIDERGQLPELQVLDLSHNSLEGLVPQSFSQLSKLQNLVALQMHGNNLSGELPHSLRVCQKLRFMDVGGNKLTGEIPTWIGQMYKMQFLNLRGNKFHGSIPSQICNLTDIQVVDLSINNLVSIIPNCFNNFTQLQSFGASTYAGNDGRCGDPLPKCPEDSSRPSISNPGGSMKEKHHNNFSFMEEVGISMTFGFIFGFWGVFGSFLLKKSWRIAFFNLFDDAGDWFYVKIVVFVSKWK
ncbi:receptor-like protein EIX2 [Salvia splendens]|uniref:receptor-like protein EIX2 n=1 Tax=Salvia splendens TaxID=180675 RepID=UPI001C257088|nr:receptor-like protein EIX2 [Salvia splendens]